MAGWRWWNSMEIGRFKSWHKTVRETLWPVANAVALHYGWQRWENRMLYALSAAVMRVKAIETPKLAEDEQMTRALLAGEMWATSVYHENIRRFGKIEDAIQWIEKYSRTLPPKMPTGSVAAALNENADVKRFSPAYKYHVTDDVTVTHAPAKWDEITIEQLIVYWYIEAMNEDFEKKITEALVHFVTGMCKMGTMTEQWRRSMNIELRRNVTNAVIEIEKRTCEYVWDYYGVGFPLSADNVADFFKYVASICKTNKLTVLCETVEQAKGKGCTILFIINQAMTFCADFNWNRFDTPRIPDERIIASEISIFKIEFEALLKNPYLRFSGKPGQTRAMANLGYLAKELLTRTAKGDSSVASYAGLNNVVITHRPFIDRIVRSYIEVVSVRGAKPLNTAKSTSDEIPVHYFDSLTLSNDIGEVEDNWKPLVFKVSDYDIKYLVGRNAE